LHKALAHIHRVREQPARHACHAARHHESEGRGCGRLHQGRWAVCCRRWPWRSRGEPSPRRRWRQNRADPCKAEGRGRRAQNLRQGACAGGSCRNCSSNSACQTSASFGCGSGLPSKEPASELVVHCKVDAKGASVTHGGERSASKQTTQAVLRRDGARALPAAGVGFSAAVIDL
jgi:hypothetical protein